MSFYWEPHLNKNDLPHPEKPKVQRESLVFYVQAKKLCTYINSFAAPNERQLRFVACRPGDAVSSAGQELVVVSDYEHFA